MVSAMPISTAAVAGSAKKRCPATAVSAVVATLLMALMRTKDVSFSPSVTRVNETRLKAPAAEHDAEIARGRRQKSVKSMPLPSPRTEADHPHRTDNQHDRLGGRVAGDHFADAECQDGERHAGKACGAHRHQHVSGRWGGRDTPGVKTPRRESLCWMALLASSAPMPKKTTEIVINTQARMERPVVFSPKSIRPRTHCPAA